MCDDCGCDDVWGNDVDGSWVDREIEKLEEASDKDYEEEVWGK